ncbi:hypothetical protein [Klenkia taihuensis]|uniref:hypothetical protein n=1 Tax=Klenkia taihuensis TaxID=1225127 RepID=UPI000B80CBCE|nr:hypothetical protein [Klenkia taihuensis]
MLVDPVTDLLAGPRGRRLCLALVHQGAGGAWPPNASCDADMWVALAAAVRDRPEPTAGLLWAALTDSVDSARYGQEPDPTDVALADPRAVELLQPVAADLVADPANAWWWAGADPADQVVVDWPLSDIPGTRQPPGRG